MFALVREGKSKRLIATAPQSRTDDTPPPAETFIVYRRTKTGFHDGWVEFVAKEEWDNERGYFPKAFYKRVDKIAEFEFEFGLPNMLLGTLIQRRLELDEAPTPSATVIRRIDFTFKDVAAAVAVWPSYAGGRPFGPRALARLTGRAEANIRVCLQVARKYGSLRQPGRVRAEHARVGRRAGGDRFVVYRYRNHDHVHFIDEHRFRTRADYLGLTRTEEIGSLGAEPGLPDEVLAGLIRDRFQLKGRVEAHSCMRTRGVNYAFRYVAQSLLLWPAIGRGRPGSKSITRQTGYYEAEVKHALGVIGRYGVGRPGH